MKKWKYKAINIRPTFNIGDFDVLGKEGWELVSVMQVPNIGTNKAIFKREIENDNDEWNYCKDIKPSGYDDALPEYFLILVNIPIANGVATQIEKACYIQELDKWFYYENDTEPVYGKVVAWQKLPKKPQLQ